jgi:hypothetical protein
MTYYRVCNRSDTKGGTSRAGTVYRSGVQDIGLWQRKAWRYQSSNQKPYIEKGQKDKQPSKKHRTTRTPLKTEDSGTVDSSCSTCSTLRVTPVTNPIISVDCPFLVAPSVFSNVYLFCLSSSCVIYIRCSQFFWIVHSWLPLRFSLTFIDCQCFWIVHSWLPLRFSLNPTKNRGLRNGRQFLLYLFHPSCHSCYKPDNKSWMRRKGHTYGLSKPRNTKTSRKSRFLYKAEKVSYWLPVSLDCPFLTAPSVFSNVYWR